MLLMCDLAVFCKFIFLDQGPYNARCHYNAIFVKVVFSPLGCANEATSFRFEFHLCDNDVVLAFYDDHGVSVNLRWCLQSS